MITLEHNRGVFDRAAGAAVALELARDGGEVCGRKAAHDGHGLATAAARLARHADDAVAWRFGACARRTPLAALALVAVIARVDKPAVRHRLSPLTEPSPR